ncbi:MAG TPA: hypothetical protein VFZ21_30360 [Gemmatimonadaceae bacterium]|nr:hypothetical protein [Gemmatimonadaceae bacterium]
MRRLALRRSARFVERSCWAVLVIGIALATRFWRAAQSPSQPYAPLMPAVSAVHPTATERELVAAAGLIVERDPFRLVRRPSPIPFTAEGDVANQPRPVIQRPALVLGGIIGGPPWTAILEGVPGRTIPIVVQRGDTLAGLRVREVAKNHAVVAGMDTVWRLTLKRIWQ